MEHTMSVFGQLKPSGGAEQSGTRDRKYEEELEDLEGSGFGNAGSEELTERRAPHNTRGIGANAITTQACR